MKLILLICICAKFPSLSVQDRMQHSSGKVPFKIADKLHLERQLRILRLFRHVDQPSYYKDHVQIADSYSVEANLDQYNKEEAVANFLRYYYDGMLPRDQIFSIFHEEHMKEATALFKLFYYAKDFDSLYKSAIWSRNCLNQGLFLYSFSVAVLHHPSTYGFVLPPIYEIYPWYFYNSDVTLKAQRQKQEQGCQKRDRFHGLPAVNASFSDRYQNVHSEESMAYYLEDVGINSFYYYHNLYRPHWMNGKEVYVNSFKRGEEFYYFHQQFVARYYLERLSNGYGTIKSLSYENALETGFRPHLIYPNGLVFPQRPRNLELDDDTSSPDDSDSCAYLFEGLQDYERRIRDGIEADHVKAENEIIEENFNDSFDALGNVIEGNPGSSIASNPYGFLQASSRRLLGCPRRSEFVLPSALEHLETSSRDPASYQVHQRLLRPFRKHKRYQSHYKYDDLVFRGVRIENVQVDKLVTFFEYFNADVTDAVYVNRQEFEADDLHLSVRQMRLNHEPFAYKIGIVSEKEGEAVVRVFVGPKCDEHGRGIGLDENRANFVEFDRFRKTLQVGRNLIQRRSEENLFGEDYEGRRSLYRRVKGAVDDEEEFRVYGSEVQFTFPSRFLLPKGKVGGQTYQFFVIISPYRSPNQKGQQMQKSSQQQQQLMHYQNYPHAKNNRTVYYYPTVGLGVPSLDGYALGYPFDRPIKKNHFMVPNSKFLDVIIYHKQLYESDETMEETGEH